MKQISQRAENDCSNMGEVKGEREQKGVFYSTATPVSLRGAEGFTGALIIGKLNCVVEGGTIFV